MTDEPLYKRVNESQNMPLDKQIEIILRIDQTRFQITQQHVFLHCYDEQSICIPGVNPESIESLSDEVKQSLAISKTPHHQIDSQEVRDVVKKYVKPHMKDEVYEQVEKRHKNYKDLGYNFFTSVVLDVLINENIEHMIDLD